jgi:glutaminase
MKRITEITKEELELLIQYQRPLFEKIFKEELVIPEFKIFTQEIKKIYDQVQKNQEGQVADYIPQLKKISPDNFALSLCTLDGQSFSLGNSNQYFSLQSISKTLNYCLALEDYGENFVHDHVGREPSGHGFNEITLDKNKRPHNPFVNAGAIMINSMVRPELEPAERFDHVMSMWKKSSAGEKTSFNNSVYLSERDSADRNFALAYFMKENNSFPKNTDILETLEFYFRCCSIEHTTHAMSIFGATLANAGFCPLTNENVFHPNTVRNCLSLMSSCGMYDFSGEFFFSIGLPAKSGVGGGLLIVIPNLMGVCLWSPALDTLGNTVKGIEFCKHLVSKYNFHHFDSLTTRHPGKINPRLKRKGKKK